MISSYIIKSTLVMQGIVRFFCEQIKTMFIIHL